MTAGHVSIVLAGHVAGATTQVHVDAGAQLNFVASEWIVALAPVRMSIRPPAAILPFTAMIKDYAAL